MELLATALTAGYCVRPDAVAGVPEPALSSLSLRHGMAPHARPSPSSAAACWCSGRATTPAGYRLARLGVDLAQRLGDPVEDVPHGGGVRLHGERLAGEPIDSCLPLLREVAAGGAWPPAS